MVKRDDLIRWFSELNNKNVDIAGGKGASLAEMYRNKFPVPPGFVITADAYKYFIEKSGIANDISRILDELDVDNTAELNKATRKIRDLIEGSKLPDDLRDEIIEAYSVLDDNKVEGASLGASDILRTSHERPFVAVRSSATTEDLADASFAGQQETFLSVKGDEELLEKVRRCFSSLFTPRATFYRQKKGFEHNKAYLAVVIQKMIDSEKSGVMFSKNPLKDDGNVIIEAVFGLGEGIVSGKILPDHYIVNPRNDFETIEKKVSDKKIALVRNSSGKVGEVKLTEEKSKREVLSQYERKRLAQFALQLEEHYKKPQDVEFAIEKEEFYIVQSRPVTTKTKQSEGEIGGNVLFSGLGASPGVASGVVKIIHNLEELGKIRRGDVLVTKMTNPDMVVAMQKAAGIVTDEGGVTSHAAIVSREMGIPAVVGTRVATEKLKDGDVVSVDGFTGRVIKGRVEERRVEIKAIVETKTNIKVIVDLPDYAERAAKSKAKGIGLVRLEGMIAEKGTHPVWYLKKGKIEEYISMIHDGLKTMAGHFDEIWMRSSDVRSDEYKNLEGAPKEVEGNPMLGDHGIRFSLKNEDLLEAEFKGVKEVADEMPRKKFGIMLPQVISVEEVKEAKRIYDKVKMPENVKFGIMVETPASVWIIKELCDLGIKFISFGTNDLTQYTLAVDRNNPEVQNLHNEMHPAVLRSLGYVIKVCKQKGIETSICGQAGSKPEMVKFLVKAGIDSISVNADAAKKVSEVIKRVEDSADKEEVEEVGNTKDDGTGDGVEGKIGNEEADDDRMDEAEVMLEDEEVKEVENPSSIPVTMKQDMSEEEAILRALDEDEYSPGFVEKEKIPELNDAIPVSSDDLKNKKEEVVIPFDSFEDVKEVGNTKDDGTGDGVEDSADKEEVIGEMDDIDDLADAALEAEVMLEVEESNSREAEAKREEERKKQRDVGQEKGDEELLDIF
ncbi:phosphoenolpyruvate synthase [Candidatus Pacearchaeota archaeon CG_4_9_14_3_um_filter_35_19]|nr:MAG: phosphoenolpyruvate synthase [Candidatus Pacearchaeota archaeon CG_4_9_14_3_um_filter_35_19]